MKNCPVYSRALRHRMTWAASAITSGRRERCIISRPPSANSTAAVATVVRGHSELQAMPAARYSAASPSMHSDMPYLESEYARCGANHCALRFNGGESVRMCGFGARLRYGRQAREVTKVPRVLIDWMRS